jgi:fibrillarin-like rRNA methylase
LLASFVIKLRFCEEDATQEKRNIEEKQEKTKKKNNGQFLPLSLPRITPFSSDHLFIHRRCE